MKTKFIKMIIFVFMVDLFSNCNKVNLTNTEAQVLIINTLDLPIRFTSEFKDYIHFPDMGGIEYNKLIQEGFLYRLAHYGKGYYSFSVTDKGKPFLISNIDGNYTFQSFDVDFNEVSGIAINQEQQTATIRFSLKASNVSPIGRILEEKIDKSRNGEFIFKKFDNGWQLASDQNKSGVDLVREIWWGRD